MMLKQAFGTTAKIDLKDIDEFLRNNFQNTLEYNNWSLVGHEVEKQEQGRVLLKDLILKFNKKVDSQFLACYAGNLRKMGFKIGFYESNDYNNKEVDLSVDYVGDKVIFTIEGDARVDFEKYFNNI